MIGIYIHSILHYSGVLIHRIHTTTGRASRRRVVSGAASKPEFNV